mmetsp:Transcript_623/g.1044  ORF Transcript_623/g.1044 Transcript_623/m.1044 type:complete len:243 (+) Transcript_623:1189-1917(+)
MFAILILFLLSTNLTEADKTDKVSKALENAGASAISKAAGIPITEAIALVKTSKTEMITGTISGQGLKEYVEVHPFQFKGLYFPEDIRETVLAYVRNIPTIAEGNKELLQKALSADLAEADYVLGSSIVGSFSFVYISYECANPECSLIQLLILGASGRMKNFPDVDIYQVTKSSALKSSTSVQFRTRERGISMQDIADMWTLMTRPLLDSSKLIAAGNAETAYRYMPPAGNLNRILAGRTP